LNNEDPVPDQGRLNNFEGPVLILEIGPLIKGTTTKKNNILCKLKITSKFY